jgi:hypothetical protein
MSYAALDEQQRAATRPHRSILAIGDPCRLKRLGSPPQASVVSIAVAIVLGAELLSEERLFVSGRNIELPELSDHNVTGML